MRRALPLLLLLACPPSADAAVAPALFADVTAASGIPSLRFGEGVNAVDLDGDGLPELVLPTVRGRDRLFANRGGLRFEEVGPARGFAGEGGIGAVVGDLDGDGRPEIAVVRGAWPSGGVSLYAEGAQGSYADVAVPAGLVERHNGIAAAIADVDGDGRADLFVSAWGGDFLYRGAGAPGRFAFIDATAAAGLGAGGRSWGALFSDLTGDGRPDLVVTRGAAGTRETTRFYANAGGGRFEDRTDATDLGRGSWSMGAVSFDCDGDGDRDLFLTGFDGPDRLYRNEGGGVLRDITAASGISSSKGVGAAAGCVDGDLLPDLVVAGFDGPVRFYRNLGGCRFSLDPAAGLQTHPRSEGVALADLDGDGDLDLYVTNYDGANRLYRNTLDDPLFLKVTLPKGALLPGATARLTRSGRAGDAGVVQELQAGSGFCSQGPAEFLFRLPDAGPWDVEINLQGGARRSLGRVGPGTARVP